MTNTNEGALKTQKILRYALLGVVVITVSIFYFLLEGTSPSHPAAKGKILNQTVEEVDPRQVYVEKLEANNALLLKRLERLENLQERTLPQEKSSSEVEGLKQNVETLHQELMQVRQTQMEVAAAPRERVHPSASSEGASSGSYRITLDLTPRTKRKASYVENSIPPGTVAQGIMLEGIDASASLTSAQDPRPVLIRITDKGRLPRKFQSDLYDCLLVATGYGDISSERVFIRSELLTCIEEETGEVNSMKVEAHIAGEDGKAGIKGVVVEKAGDMMFAAGLSGFFSGVGSFMESYNRSPFILTNPLEAQSLTGVGKGAAVSGIGSGAKSGFDRISEYYVKKAEHIHPVIQIASGRLINVVFTQMASFEETSVREAITDAREKGRQDAVQTIQQEKGIGK